MTLVSSPRARRYTIQGVLSMTVFALVLAVILGDPADDAQARPHAASPSSKQAQPPAGSSLDPTAYSYAQALRERAALSAEDLAAMDLSQAEAEAVLGRLGVWCASNLGRLSAAELAVFEAERDRAALERGVRTGQATALERGQISTLSQAIQTKQQAYQALLLEGAGDAIQAVPAKQDDWARASEFARMLPVELRHLSTMSRSRLTSLMLQAGQQGVPMEEALDFSERQEVQAIRQRVSAKRQLMQAAEAEVLPVPEALRDLAVGLE